jgi:hypothetical protein
MKMRIVMEVLVGWSVLSCSVGPVLTWLSFWGERRARAIGAAGHRSSVPTYKSRSSTWRLTTAVVVPVLAIGSLGAILQRNGAAADADIVDLRGGTYPK